MISLSSEYNKSIYKKICLKNKKKKYLSFIKNLNFKRKIVRKKIYVYI